MVYGDGTVTDVACKGLNGMRMGDRTLTVRRATEVTYSSYAMPCNQNAYLHTSVQQHYVQRDSKTQRKEISMHLMGILPGAFVSRSSLGL